MANCEFCGAYFEAVKSKRFCSPACGKKYRNALQRQATADKKADIERKKQLIADIGKITKEAAEHGMSYGQWVAFNRKGG